MTAPPVYLDECVDCELAPRLVQRGFVVTTAAAQGMVGASDEEQLAYATQHDWVILTHNRRHFQREHHEYVRQHRPHSGIIILPQRCTFDRLELRAAMMLDWITTESAEYQSRLFLWNDLQLQLTHGLQLAGYTASEVKQVLGQSP
jgi:hypothetical protein